jgi:hypothetical protein
MGFIQKAPAAALGLFLFFGIPLICGAWEELSFSARTGTLWVSPEGAAWYEGGGLSYATERGFLGIDLGLPYSTLKWADLGGMGADHLFFRYAGGFGTEKFGLGFSGGLFYHDLIKSELGAKPFYSEGGTGVYFRTSAPVRIRGLTLEPSLLYAQGQWDQGSFYWFLGKPRIPLFLLPGISAAYGEHHRLYFSYFTLDLRILNNFEEPLFDFPLNGFTASYTFSLEKTKTRFEGTLGYFFAGGSLEGILTAENQQYFLFPYNFFKAKADLQIHLAYGRFTFTYRPGMLQYQISAGAVHAFGGDLEAATHYKKKKLFGAEEAMEDLSPLNFRGIGAAFLGLDAGIPSLAIGRTKAFHASLGLRKTFFVPWGYEQLLTWNDLGPEEGSGGGGGFSSDLLWTVLLSGISLYFTLSY